MKPHFEERNEQMRKEYKKLLAVLPWKEAVAAVAKKYFHTVSTTEAIIFYRGKYGRKENKVDLPRTLEVGGK